FTGARKWVFQTFATTQSALMKKRVMQFMTGTDCPVCHGKRLRPDVLRVKLSGLDIAEVARLPLKELVVLLQSSLKGSGRSIGSDQEKAIDQVGVPTKTAKGKTTSIL